MNSIFEMYKTIAKIFYAKETNNARYESESYNAGFVDALKLFQHQINRGSLELILRNQPVQEEKK